MVQILRFWLIKSKSTSQRLGSVFYQCLHDNSSWLSLGITYSSVFVTGYKQTKAASLSASTHNAYTPLSLITHSSVTCQPFIKSLSSFKICISATILQKSDERMATYRPPTINDISESDYRQVGLFQQLLILVAHSV
jgi:hypothetical protein